MATCAGLALPLLGLAVPASAAVSASTAGGGSCSAGARTLSPPGSHVYSETGNGGYTSQHTLVHLVYNAKANKFLTGNRVELTSEVDPDLIGGLVIRVGNMVLDASVRNRLERLRRQVASAT